MHSVKMTPKMGFGHVYLTLAACMSSLFQFLRWFIGSVIFAHNRNPLLLSLTSSNKSASDGTPSNEPQGKKFRQYVTALSATVGPFAVGTVLAWTSPALPMLLSADSTIKITPDQGSWVGSLIAIGAIFGSIPAGKTADLIGRKPVIAFLPLPFITSWLLIYFAKDVWYLYVARLVAGTCLGAITATVPMYIGEIAEKSIRGELCSYVQVNVTLGILYVYSIGPFVNYAWLAIMCGILPVIWFILVLLVLPESPTYLWRSGKNKEAEDVLVMLRGKDYDISGELQALQKELEEKKPNGKLKDMVKSKATLRAAFTALGLFGFLSCSGINVVIFNAQTIFSSTGSIVSPKTSSIVIGILQVIFTFTSSQLVDRAGRRVLLLISDSVMAVCLGSLGFYFWQLEHGVDTSVFSLVPLISLGVYISTFSLGFGPIPGVMVGELFSPEFKGLAIGIVCVLASLIEFSVVKSYQTLLDNYGRGVTFGVFAGCCVMGTLFVLFLVPETKNKSLQEIQDELSGKKKSEQKQGPSGS
ncbi:facilitated trehalose transporter Tret1-2 homolog [Acyrthosiphon pisum]|uniref:Major facilitator superfamily (MFS) profile domain-containing protein n=1 Tax=Acyrthosiphon pisum TaxID=7029 RepID=A0A8R2H9S3_ACYPI|nr:facilitated trehalose transporter Tret1-2 homolog [Acyrthosiphon pisum]XP_016660712.1 facilitated trehalose transporter Tret1-2 homolog [Acyrthosiphon pisum]|eukprot:XP_001946479.3 PREDICTED: facilitated trehalose transporter Tret1-2 homolog [Acyrthosiphon pisum]